MKSVFAKYLGAALLITSYAVYAESQTNDIEILAQRGKGIVTQTDFTARADKIPEHLRFSVLRDTTRLRNVLNTLLLRAQLAADAREAGYDKEQIVQDRMRLAADAELADAWLQNYVDMQPGGDYEQLALETYQLNKHTMMSPARIDVSHILV